jgi:hypothetical protein
MAKPLTFQEFPYAGETPPTHLAWSAYYDALPVTAGMTHPDGSAEVVRAAPPPFEIFEAGFAAGVEWAAKRARRQAFRKDDPDAK